MKEESKLRSSRIGVLTMLLVGAALSSVPAQQPPPGGNGPGSLLQQLTLTPEELDKRAAALLNANRIEEALALYKQALARNPKDVQAYVGLGSAYGRTNRFEDAAQAFRKAIELSPCPDFYYFLGSALSGAGKYREARHTFEMLLDAVPGNVRALLSIGETYRREGAYPDARATFVEALGFAPDNPDVHNALGNIALQENRFAEALDEFEAALRADAKNVDSALGRASALSGLKRHAEAEKTLREMVAAAPKESGYRASLAQILDAAGKRGAAVAEYKQALQLAPDDAITWGNLGWTQYEMGRYADSVASSRQALQRSPKLAYVRFNLGLVFAVQNEWKAAEKAYAEAVAIASDSEIRAALNDITEARKKQPTARALRQAADYLAAARHKLLARSLSR